MKRLWLIWLFRRWSSRLSHIKCNSQNRRFAPPLLALAPHAWTISIIQRTQHFLQYFTTCLYFLKSCRTQPNLTKSIVYIRQFKYFFMSYLFSFRRLQLQTAQNFGCSRMLQGNPILIIALLWTGVGYLVDFLRLLLTFFNLFQKCHKRVSLHHTAGILLRLLCLHITEHQTGKPCFKIMFWPLCKQFLFSNFQVFDHHFTEIDQKVYMTATLIPILALCSIRNLKRLAPISMLANMLQMVGLGLTFFYLLRDLPPTWDRKPFATW